MINHRCDELAALPWPSEERHIDLQQKTVEAATINNKQATLGRNNHLKGDK